MRPKRSLAQVAREARGIVVFVGTPHLDRDLYNACAVCAGGEVKAIYRKRFLPNYGVFDEHRYFAPGRDLFLLEHGEVLVGPTVCEDVWQPGPPATDLALAGAQLIVNISASPFHVGKEREREQMLQTRARDNVCYVAFVNAVGRPGRARVRRALGRARRRGRGARTRAGVRGSAARRRHRAAGSGWASPTRRPATVARERAGNGAGRAGCPRRLAAPSERDRLRRRRSRRSSTSSSRCGCALELGLRDYIREERLRRRGGQCLRRHRLGVDRGDRLRGARARARPLRLHAFPVQLRRDAPGCPAAGGGARRALPRAADRVDRRGASSRRSRRCSRAGSRTRPRRTSRLGFEASS